MSDEPGFVRVPHTRLQPDTLRAVIESFVHREGTDYGAQERSVESKVAEVMAQLEDGSVALVFDPQEESVTLVPIHQLRPR